MNLTNDVASLIFEEHRVALILLYREDGINSPKSIIGEFEAVGEYFN